MLKFAKNKNIFKIVLMVMTISACATIQPEETTISYEGIEPKENLTESVNFQKYVDKVIIASKTPSTIVYEYQDIRVDEVALLAAVYCQENGNRNAYLEKINLYKNNKRRAIFYCSSK